ncbi:MAG: glycosyltransferase [Flavobacteriaceae bacterium]
MFITVLFYTFVAVVIVQILYYISFTSFAFSKGIAKEEEQLLPVSIIICAKNEAKNLRSFLPAIISQEYPKFEIVLINDTSSDDTLEIMEFYKKINNTIKIVNVDANEAFWGSKKYALTLGIKAAKYEHLLFTDADCKPISKFWIQEMVKQFNTSKQIVLGYSSYKKVSNSITNLLVRYETLLTAIQYFSYAKLGNPYMGVGRNLAYTKAAFFKVNGFVKHLQIKSGDDDLFIQEVANKENTSICFSPDSFTESLAPKNFSEWFRQKRRHISTSKYYRFNHQLLLGGFYISKFLLFTLFISLLFTYNWFLVVIIVSIYYMVQFLVVGFSAKKLNELRLIFLLPLLEISLLLFQFAIFIANIVSKPNHWK